MSYHSLSSLFFALFLILQDPNPVLDRIQAAYDRQDDREALRLADEAVASLPDNADAWRLRAMVKRRLRDLEGALSDYSRALELDPRNARAWNGRGLAKLALGNPRGALIDLDEALRLDSQYHQGWDARASIKWELKDFQGAIEDSGRAIELSPRSSYYYQRRALSLENLGDMAGAEADFDRAFALDPRNLEALYGRAGIRRRLKRFEDAIADYTVLVEKGHRTADTLYWRGETLRVAGRQEDARSDFALALQKGLRPEYVSSARAALGQEAAADSPGAQPRAITAGEHFLAGRIPARIQANEDVLWAQPALGLALGASGDEPAILGSVTNPARDAANFPAGGAMVCLAGMRVLMGSLEPSEEKKLAAKRDAILKGKPLPPEAVTPPKAVVELPPEGGAGLTPEEEARARREAILERQSLIAILQRNHERERADWQNAKDPSLKEKFYLRMLQLDASIQQEKDQIHFLNTGERIYTRTAADNFCHDLMIIRAQQQAMDFQRQALRVEATMKVGSYLDKALDMAPADQRKQLRDFIDRQLKPMDFARGDLAKARQVAEVVHKTVQGNLELDQAKRELTAIEWDDYVARAEKVRTRSALAVMGYTIAAPIYTATTGVTLAVGGNSWTALSATHGFASGYSEGGVVEGVKQAVAMTGLPGLVAAEAMTGYERGGMFSKGGVVGAVERSLEALMLGKVIEVGVSKIGSYCAGQKTPPGVAPKPPPKGPTLAEQLEDVSYKMIRREADRKVRQFKQLTEKIKAATTAGNSAEAARFQSSREELIREMNEDLLAKRLAKRAHNEGRRAGGEAEAEFAREFAEGQQTLYRTKVDPLFKDGVKEAGFHWRKKGPDGRMEKAGELEFHDFTHDGGGPLKPNTDRDLALLEKEGYVLYKNNSPVSLAHAEEELQRGVSAPEARKVNRFSEVGVLARPSRIGASRGCSRQTPSSRACRGRP